MMKAGKAPDYRDRSAPTVTVRPRIKNRSLDDAVTNA